MPTKIKKILTTFLASFFLIFSATACSVDFSNGSNLTDNPFVSGTDKDDSIVVDSVVEDSAKEDPSSGKEDLTVAVTSLELSEKNLSLTVGRQHLLTATVLPQNATDSSVSWTSSDPFVATVSNGLVSAVSAGKATIVASTPNGKISMCTVTVTEKTANENTHDYQIKTLRYQAVSAPMEEKPVVAEALTDGNHNYYLLDLGYVKNVPLASGFITTYNGQTPITISIEKSQITQTAVEQSASKTVSQSISTTTMNMVSAEVSIKIGKDSWPLSATITGGYSRTWGDVTENANSTTNTWTTAESFSNTITESLTATIGEHGEKTGCYRFSLFATCDLYAHVKTSRDNSKLEELSFAVLARTNPQFAIDYDETGDNFDKSSYEDRIQLPENYHLSLPIPKAPTTESLKSNSQIVQSSFSSYLWAENKNLGKANFSVTGIKVKYENRYYIYGNAWYNNTLGGERFNDVASLYLKNSTHRILMGGILHWRSSYDDNNESGVASWNRSDSIDYTNIAYMPEDPGKDISPNENISLSITDICVECEGSPNDYDGVPEIVTSTLKTDFVCESKKIGTVNFDLIGIKAKYNGLYYLMGSAWYSGKPGSYRFNDVGDIYLENCNKKILFGGTLGWRGSLSDNNESGICGYNRNDGFNSTKIRYMMEDPGKDFAGDDYNYISITGICVCLGGDATNDELVPEIVTTSFVSSLYMESSFRGTGNFTCIGIKAYCNDKAYLYGNAFSSGTPGGERFNDVASFKITDTTKKFLLGGTLHWYGTNNDNNESAIAGFNRGESTDSLLMYLQEDPGKDFAANEGNELSITGICLEI